VIVVDIKTIHSIDLKLTLLSGEPIYTGKVKIEPLKVRDISKIGFMKYQQYLSILTAKPNDLIVIDESSVPEDITTFEVILSLRREELVTLLVDGLCLFLGKDLSEEQSDHIIENGLLFGKDTIVNKSNFNEIIEIIKCQNGLTNIEEKYNPKDNKAQSIIDKLKKGKEWVSKKKSNSNENIDFSSIVSSVSTKSNHYNFNNIFDLTVYQLYEEYNNLNKIDGYNTNILAMINGAKDVELKHWSTK
jgi:hypothetical protein